MSSSTASRPWTTARTASAVSMTQRRSSRSAQTPPTSSSTASGTVPAATTSPRSVAEPEISSTAKASAMGAIRSPKWLTAWPNQYRRNTGSDNGPNRVRQPGGASGLDGCRSPS